MSFADAQTAMLQTPECGLIDSITVKNYVEATEFSGLKIASLDLMSEISAAVQMFEKHNEPHIAQALSTTLHNTEGLLETMTNQYRQVERAREKVNFSIAFRREMIRDHDKEKRKDDIDEKEEEENRRMQEEQFQSEIDESDNLKTQFLECCRNSQDVLRHSQKTLNKIMRHYWIKRILWRLWTLWKLLFCVSFAITMVPNFEYVLRVARREDL